MVFDELTDAEELAKLFGQDTTGNQQLMAEIVEEEKICEIVAKADEKKAAENGEQDEDDE